MNMTTIYIGIARVGCDVSANSVTILHGSYFCITSEKCLDVDTGEGIQSIWSH